MTDLMLFATLFATYGVITRQYCRRASWHGIFSLAWRFAENDDSASQQSNCRLALLSAHVGRKNVAFAAAR